MLQVVPPLLSLSQQEITKKTISSMSLTRAGHEWIALSLCPPLWGCAEESHQRQDPIWSLLLAASLS